MVFCLCIRILIFVLLINVTNESNFKQLQHFRISFPILQFNGLSLLLYFHFTNANVAPLRSAH